MVTLHATEILMKYKIINDISSISSNLNIKGNVLTENRIGCFFLILWFQIVESDLLCVSVLA